MAIMSTFYFITQGEYSETLKIARMVLSDTEAQRFVFSDSKGPVPVVTKT